MLSHITLSYSPNQSIFSPDQGLRERIIHDCACICIRSAQNIVSNIHEHYNANSGGILIPWWLRLFYLHVAATVLIAARLQPDLFPQFEISKSWDQLISILHAHEHLSPFVSQSKIALQTLSFEATEIHAGDTFGLLSTMEGQSGLTSQDLFEDIDFSPFNVPFGLEDMF
jgi:hypothetical protein